MSEHDAVNRPAHYNTGRFIHSECGKPIEVIDITAALNFCRGNSVKYVLRCEDKGHLLEDLRKARRYLNIEIGRLESAAGTAEILSDPETMAVIREGGQEISRHGASWPEGSTATVRYVPYSEQDPWGARTWTELMTGNETVNGLKAMVVAQLGFGHPDGFVLRATGSDFDFTEKHVISEAITPGQVIELVRVPFGLANDERTRL